VLDGTGEAAVVVAGFVVLFCACVRYTILSVRDDPLTSLLVSRRGLIGWMSGRVPHRPSPARRAARRRRARGPRDALRGAAELEVAAAGAAPPPRRAGPGLSSSPGRR